MTSIVLLQGPWTEEEDQLIILAQKIHGNRFAEIAKMVRLNPECAQSHVSLGSAGAYLSLAQTSQFFEPFTRLTIETGPRADR